MSEDGHCCTPDSGDCCGPGSWCCTRAGKHEHDEDDSFSWAPHIAEWKANYPTRTGVQVIPEAAVEAAAYALFLDANPDSELQWFDIGFHDQDELMRTATKALEAAAPFIAAAAFQRGYVAAIEQAAK